MTDFMINHTFQQIYLILSQQWDIDCVILTTLERCSLDVQLCKRLSRSRQDALSIGGVRFGGSDRPHMEQIRAFFR